MAVWSAASVSWHGRAMVGTGQPWGERVEARLRQGDSQSLYLLSWFVVPWKFWKSARKGGNRRERRFLPCQFK